MAAAYPANTSPKKKSVVVIGAGVIGLTTALKLQKHDDYQVTVVAEIIPSDPKSIKYTSRWAGAHHVYNPINDTEQHFFEEETFKVMWELSEPGNDAEESFLRIPQTEYFFVERPKPEPLEKMPHPEELIPGAVSGCTFTTVSIDVPIYLNYLLTRFLGAGGRIMRGSLLHISQILEGGTSLFAGGSHLDALPDALVVCAGIGARFLGGVEDKNIYPVRGQTVLIRAPWVRFGRSETLDESGACTYIIPRRSSDVIVGGTRGIDDWYPQARPEITEDILKRGLALCPELAPPEVRAVRKPTLDDLLSHVVGQGCGLRPARKGGFRLELEWFDGKKVKRDDRIPIIHNYGSGVIGLTTALKIQEKGCYQVEIIADVLPSDPKTVRYTSHWAGAHYVSYHPTGTEEAEIDHTTFLEMWALSAPGGDAEDCFLRLSQTEYLEMEQGKPSPFERMPGVSLNVKLRDDFSKVINASPQFREVPKEKLIPGANYGYTFETVTIDVPLYLKYLTKRVVEAGINLVKGYVQHIDQVLEAGTWPFREDNISKDPISKTSALESAPDAVIVCAGLGARFLGGVEDLSVYPSRGQTVLLRAPWVRFGCSLETGDTWTYIIPRKSGDVVVGGIQDIDDWNPKPRPETRQDLLTRGLSLCPQLIPPEIRGDVQTSDVNTLIPLIVDEGCGLRPMRKGGPRRELEYRIARGSGDRIPVIYNYGHGTQGFIQSIGSAKMVLRLLEEA
ncbi:D-amino-acid oxidase [Psilocybe cubensis]|uniref:D-amino-acid oxidase n=1 Tax=Psilocybe cubensis TaxID=181762 RepID=A0ACB8GR61_PSICU|nr:D-amino-acid oxidase [Psilocybe cubensis]KAH9477485.1 D-amino-acid oxidase [Psilocybe cubensis]